MSVSRTLPARESAVPLIIGTLIFIAIAAIGLFYVKWDPYWHKAHVAAATHALGSSIISGKAVAPPAAGWDAALQYATAYYKSVWEAVVLALILGAAVQVLVPRAWLLSLIGRADARSAAVAGALSLGGMMCTCCASPVTLGLRRQRVSAGSAFAFLLGNPVLNPAVLIFMAFVLGWQFTVLRVVAGLLLIVAIVWMANRMQPSDVDAKPHAFNPAPIERENRSPLTIASAFLRELWYEALTIIPGYVIIVLALGAVRAFLFPAGFMIHASGIGATVLTAIAGTLFVIPTAGEIPIVQMLMQHGMGVGPAAALIIALPAISLPTLFIVRTVFSARVLWSAMAVVCAFSIVAGVAAIALHFA